MFTGERCMECRRESNNRWRAENRDHRNAWKREWARKNPEKVREAKREWWDKYYPAHKEKVAAYHRRRYLDRGEELREQHRRWAQQNPEKIREKKRVRRARLADVVSDLTSTQWDAILAWHSSPEGTRCAYCFGACKPTLDHVVPISKGGGHTAENVVPACGPCNFSKQDKEVSKWVS